MEHYKSIHPSKFYQEYLEHNVRPDGRELDQFRSMAINLPWIETADGSACIRIGNTCVFCGIKAELGQPKAEEPDKGFLVVNVELPSLCSSEFKAGPPGDKAQVITAFINEFIESSEIVNVKDLCITVDQLVWVLYCDIICFDYDGSVMDACFASLICALQTVKLHKIEYNGEIDEINLSEERQIPVNILYTAICTTFAAFNNDMILSDPTNKEESLSLGLISVITDGEKLLAVDKRGRIPLAETQIQDCISKAKVRSLLVKDLMKTTLKT